MNPLPDWFHERVDRYLVGELPPQEFAEFQQLLTDSEEAREEFVRFNAIHTMLPAEMRARESTQKFLQTIPDLESASRRPAWQYLLAFSIGIFFCGAVLFIGLNRGDAETSQPVAWLSDAQNCSWQEGEDPSLQLQPGSKLNLLQGLAQIQLSRGAVVILEGPSRIEILDDNGIRMERGKLSARVPESAHGFVVVSPQGKIIDRGTEFGVSVSEQGQSEVRVFEGLVEATGTDSHMREVKVAERFALNSNKVEHVKDVETNAEFTRAIVLPPRIVPQIRHLTFREAIPGTLQDRDQAGIGFTHRLPGTGSALLESDVNLKLNREVGRLELTTTDSDINNQILLNNGEYFGIRLADLGFTGTEDFEILARIPAIPDLQEVGQFGVYAGTRSDRVIRGGLIASRREDYRQFMTNNNGGVDRDSNFVGLYNRGEDSKIILRRVDGKYTMSVESETSGFTTSLNIRHPSYLDQEKDLQVGLFGANTRSEVRRTLFIREVKITVWTKVVTDKK
jgi:ferric-dicitrate binding protein FerR (iron transport regulator)